MTDSLVDNGTDVNTKTKIFMVSAHLFAEKGYNGVSMREISEQSGVSKPTIYYYFGSKEGIYKSLVDTGLAHILSSLERIQAQEISAKEKLVMLLKTYFRETLQRPEFIRFFINLFNSSENIAFLETAKTEAIKHWKTLSIMIQQGIDSGEFGASAKPQLAAAIIGGVLSNFIWQQLNSKEQILSDQLAEDIIEMLFKGLNE